MRKIVLKCVVLGYMFREVFNFSHFLYANKAHKNINKAAKTLNNWTKPSKPN